MRFEVQVRQKLDFHAAIVMDGTLKFWQVGQRLINYRVGCCQFITLQCQPGSANARVAMPNALLDQFDELHKFRNRIQA